MGTIAHSSWLVHALRRLPDSWLAVLDSWSARIARNRRERRRTAGLRFRQKAEATYKLRPWRD